MKLRTTAAVALLATSVSFLALVEASPPCDMTLANDRVLFTFNPASNGGLVSIVDLETGTEFRNDEGAAPLLFQMTLLLPYGKERILSNLNAGNFDCSLEEVDGASILQLACRDVGQPGLDVLCSILLPDEGSLAEWRITIESASEIQLRTVEFPCFSGMASVGQGSEDDWWLYPYQEGMIMPRSRSEYLFRENQRRACYYPGDGSMQFMALYDEVAGLYTSTHDAAGHPKRFEYFNQDGHMRWQVHTLCEESPRERYEQAYPAIVGVFHGDWTAAADVYREWAWQQSWCEVRSVDRTDLPGWYQQGDPVLEMHNYFECEGQPDRLVNGLADLPERLLTFSRAFGAATTLYLIGWEQHAIWDNPLSMPPREGYEAFSDMVNSLHNQGNRVALVRSAMKWGDTSPGFAELGAQFAITERDGSTFYGNLSLADGYSPRYGMCPATEDWKIRMEENAQESAELHIDWLTMDECPIGCYPHACYASLHGHPQGSGTWWAEETYELLRRESEAAKATNPDMLCPMESASELYIPVADGYYARRASADFYHYEGWARSGVLFPPIFQYVYHEYIVPFSDPHLSLGEEHENLDYFRLVYANALAGGELLSVGSWRPTAAGALPQAIEIFNQHLVMWQAFAREYLAYGRMERPPTLSVEEIGIRSINDRVRTYDLRTPAVVASAWTSPFGSRGYLFENVSSEAQTIAPELTSPEGGASQELIVLTVRNCTIEGAYALGDHPESIELAPGDIVLVSVVPPGTAEPPLAPAGLVWTPQTASSTAQFTARITAQTAARSAVGLLTITAMNDGGETVEEVTRLIPTLGPGQTWQVSGQLTLPWGMPRIRIRAKLAQLSPVGGAEGGHAFQPVWNTEHDLELPVPGGVLPGEECTETLAKEGGRLLPVDGISPGSVALEGWWYTPTPAAGGGVDFNALEDLRFDGRDVIVCEVHEDPRWRRFAMQFWNGFDASAFDGIEIEIYSDVAGLCEVEFPFLDPALPPEEEGDRHGVSVGVITCAVQVGPELRRFRIPFSAMDVSTWVLSQHPQASPVFHPEGVFEVAFNPLVSEGRILVSQVAFYAEDTQLDGGSAIPQSEAPGRRILLQPSGFLASLGNDLPENPLSSFARLLGVDELDGAMGGMKWDSPDPTDLTCDLGANGVEGFSGISITLSASEAMDVDVWLGVLGSFCGDTWHSAAPKEPLSVGREPRAFRFPFSAFTEDPRRHCAGGLSQTSLEGIESIILLPSAGAGELRFHEAALLEGPVTDFVQPTATENQDASEPLDWEMTLTEPGLTTYALRYRFPEDSAEFLGLRLSPLKASAFTGIEFEAKADRAIPVRVWITSFDSSLPGEADSQQAEWAVAAEPIVLSAASDTFQIPFEQFRVPDDVLGARPSIATGIDLAALRGIYLEPLETGAELEISYLALYLGMSSGPPIYRYIDGFSIRSGDSLGEWVAGSRATDPSRWRSIAETLLTTTAWQDHAVVHLQGGTLEVVVDPTGSDRGLVCRVTVPPRVEDGQTLAKSDPQIERWPGVFVSRIYGGIYFPFQEPPCVTSMDVYVDEELFATAIESTSATILLDVYDRCVDPEGTGCWMSSHGESQNSSLQAKLWTGSKVADDAYLSLKFGTTAWEVASREAGAPPFTPNEWHTISIAIHADGMAELYQDGLLVARHHTGPIVVGGTTGGHPGLYIHDSTARGLYAVRGTFLYDNYRIRCAGDLDIAAIIAEQVK